MLCLAAGIPLVLLTSGKPPEPTPAPEPSQVIERRTVHLPAVFYTGNLSGPVINQTQAKTVLQEWWPVSEKALATNDVSETDALEEGAAAQYDDGVTVDNLARKVNLRTIRKYTDTFVFVPKQTSYPAFFVGFVKTTVYPTSPQVVKPGTPYIETLIFLRRNQGSPWKVVLNEGSGAGYPDLPAVDKDGFLTQAAPPKWIDPKAVPPLLASYWQSWNDLGGAPPGSNFKPGFWTNEFGQRLIDATRLDAAQHGHRDSRTFSVDLDRDGFWQFPMKGVEIACFTVRYSKQLTPVSAASVLTQSRSRAEFGGWIAPGTYKSITLQSLQQHCARIGPSEADGIMILGGNGGPYDGSGVRAAPPKPTPTVTALGPAVPSPTPTPSASASPGLLP